MIITYERYINFSIRSVILNNISFGALITHFFILKVQSASLVSQFLITQRDRVIITGNGYNKFERLLPCYRFYFRKQFGNNDCAFNKFMRAHLLAITVFKLFSLCARVTGRVTKYLCLRRKIPTY